MAPEVNHKRVELVKRSESLKPRPPSPPADTADDDEGGTMVERVLQSFEALNDEDEDIVSRRRAWHGLLRWSWV